MLYLMTGNTVSTRISGELAEQVEKLSSVLGRTKSWLLRNALQAYVASERQFIDGVQEAVDAYRAGEVVDHADVVADWRRRKEPSS
jgi:predicted transcriptional regulator